MGLVFIGNNNYEAESLKIQCGLRGAFVELSVRDQRKVISLGDVPTVVQLVGRDIECYKLLSNGYDSTILVDGEIANVRANCLWLSKETFIGNVTSRSSRVISPSVFRRNYSFISDAMSRRAAHRRRIIQISGKFNVIVYNNMGVNGEIKLINCKIGELSGSTVYLNGKYQLSNCNVLYH